MATKKQKRLAALERRAQFLEEERQRGLEAQARSRYEREHDAQIDVTESKSTAKRHRKTLSSEEILNLLVDDVLESRLRAALNMSANSPLIQRLERGN